MLYGHYAWATLCYLVTATAGTVLALLLARAQAVPYDGHTLVTMLALSWALFGANVAIQFPLLIRFGYTRASVLATTLPMAAVVGTAYKTHLSMVSIQDWLPLLCAAGVAALVISVAVATVADRRRVRYGRSTPSTGTLP